MAKDHTIPVALGPSVVPLYPVTAFSRFTGIDFREVWKLVGPTVNRNINAPLWAQFCATYLEGLNHGAGTVRDEYSESEIEKLRAEVRDLRQQRDQAISVLGKPPTGISGEGER